MCRMVALKDLYTGKAVPETPEVYPQVKMTTCNYMALWGGWTILCYKIKLSCVQLGGTYHLLVEFLNANVLAQTTI